MAWLYSEFGTFVSYKSTLKLSFEHHCIDYFAEIMVAHLSATLSPLKVPLFIEHLFSQWSNVYLISVPLTTLNLYFQTVSHACCKKSGYFLSFFCRAIIDGTRLVSNFCLLNLFQFCHLLTCYYSATTMLLVQQCLCSSYFATSSRASHHTNRMIKP